MANLLRSRPSSLLSHDLSLMYDPTRISWTSYTHADVKEILSLTRNLKTLSLGLTDNDSPDDAALAPSELPLPFLTTLRLRRVFVYSEIPAFIMNVRAQQLKTLHIDAVARFIASIWDWGASLLVPFLAFTGCQLETLIVDRVHIHGETVVSMLENCHTIKTVVFRAQMICRRRRSCGFHSWKISGLGLRTSMHTLEI